MKRGNSRSILVFGSSGSPSELFLLVKLLQKVEYFEMVYVDMGYISAKQKKHLKKYEEYYPCSINFLPPEQCRANSFDLCISLSVAMRFISPFRYNKENAALKELGIDTTKALWSDINRADVFALCTMNLQKFFLKCCKVGGLY